MNKFLSMAILLSSTLAVAELPLKLALNWKAEPQFGGFYEPGLKEELKKLGFNLQVLEGGSGTPTVQMLANGKVDLAVVSAEEILLNNDKNPELKVLGLFAVFQTNPQMIMCRPELKFKNLDELMNSKSTISLQAGLTYAQYLKKKYAQTQTRWVPYLGGISNFVNSKEICQQGFFTSEPLLARAQGIQPDVFLISSEGFNPYTTVVAMRASEQKRIPIPAVIQAIRSAWTRYLNQPEFTNSLMQKINKSMDQKAFAASALAQLPLIDPKSTTKTSVSHLGEMTLARWQELIEQMQSLGLIKSPLKAAEQFVQP